MILGGEHHLAGMKKVLGFIEDRFFTCNYRIFQDFAKEIEDIFRRFNFLVG